MSVCFLCGHAQEDAYLRTMTTDLVGLRSKKASESALKKLVINWSASNSPKLAIMDDIRFDRSAEYRGSGANMFKVNQLITQVRKRQNPQMVSRGEFFNSTERGVFYSAIEKTIKGGCTARYTLTGHIGRQEFVIIPFNSNSKFTATVNSIEARETTTVKGAMGVRVVNIGRVGRDDKITITITNPSRDKESFVILNHNPQK